MIIFRAHRPFTATMTDHLSRPQPAAAAAATPPSPNSPSGRISQPSPLSKWSDRIVPELMGWEPKLHPNGS